MPASVKGLMLGFFIEVAKRWKFPTLKGLSLRHYDPRRNSLVADENWGCWPHYVRPPEVIVNEKSLSGWSFLNNAFGFEPDIRNSRFYTKDERRGVAEQGFVSTLALSLPWQGRKIGTMQLYFTKIIKLTSEFRADAYFLARLGATIVYEWLLSQAEKEVRGAMRHTNKHRALRIFLRQVALLLGVDRCVIYLAEKEKGRVKLEQGFPFKNTHGIGQVFEIKDKLPYLELVVTQGNPIFFKRKDPLLHGIVRLLEANNMSGIVAAPISVLGEIRAFLVLDHPEKRPLFTETDYGVLHSLLDSGSDLLTRFYFEEERIKTSVFRIIASIQHEITTSLMGIRANHKDPKLVLKYLMEADSYLQNTLAIYRGGGLEFTVLLLDSLVEKVVEDCLALDLAEGKKIELDLQGYKGKKQLLSGNEDLIYRALFNLILNGLEEIKAGQWVRVVLKADQNNAIVEVTTPTSINGVDPERIFDPQETDKGPARGTGLYIVNLIAEAHGGRVSLSSKEKITTFCLFLPFQKSIGK